MHVISLQALRKFWQRYPAAEGPMRNWHRIMEATDFDDFNDLGQTFGSADYAKPYIIFDIGGNNWRIVTVIHFEVHKVYIRWVMTHAEYSGWCKRYKKGKV